MPISFIVFYFYSLFVLPGCCDEQTSEPANSQKLSFSEWQIATTSRLFPEIWLTWFWINLFYQIIIKKETGDISSLLLLIPVHNIPVCFRPVPKNHTGYQLPYWTGFLFKHERLSLTRFLCRGTASTERSCSWKWYTFTDSTSRKMLCKQAIRSFGNWKSRYTGIRALRHICREKNQ